MIVNKKEEEEKEAASCGRLTLILAVPSSINAGMSANPAWHRECVVRRTKHGSGKMCRQYVEIKGERKERENYVAGLKVVTGALSAPSAKKNSLPTNMYLVWSFFPRAPFPSIAVEQDPPPFRRSFRN